jgi:hypothetical protein
MAGLSTEIAALGRRQTLAEWAAELRVNARSIRSRINFCGWDPERAVTTPFGLPHRPDTFPREMSAEAAARALNMSPDVLRSVESKALRKCRRFLSENYPGLQLEDLLPSAPGRSVWDRLQAENADRT